jgi:hypothetical protein
MKVLIASLLLVTAEYSNAQFLGAPVPNCAQLTNVPNTLGLPLCFDCYQGPATPYERYAVGSKIKGTPVDCAERCLRSSDCAGFGYLPTTLECYNLADATQSVIESVDMSELMILNGGFEVFLNH